MTQPRFKPINLKGNTNDELSDGFIELNRMLDWMFNNLSIEQMTQAVTEMGLEHQIHIGDTAPSDKTMLWYDTSTYANTGEQGPSAYQIWLDEGNIGTEQDFLDSLVGAQGIQGIQGAKGDTGDAADKTVFIADWDNTIAYAVGDACYYDGKFYKSLTASNTSNQPDTSTSDWENISTGGEGGDCGFGIIELVASVSTADYELEEE